MLRARRLSLQFSECDLLIIITVIIIICSGCCYPCCTEFQYGKPPQSLYLSTAHTHFPRLGPSAIQRPPQDVSSLFCVIASSCPGAEYNTLVKTLGMRMMLAAGRLYMFMVLKMESDPRRRRTSRAKCMGCVYRMTHRALTHGRRPYRLRVVARDCNYCCKFRTDHKDYYYIWSVLYILCVKFLGFCYSLEYVCQQMRVDSTRGGFRFKCFKVSRSVVNLDYKEESRNRITSTVGSVNNIETRK